MNLRTRRRSDLPRLNTRQWGWRPTKSGSKVLFRARNPSTNVSKVILADRRTGRRRTRARARGRGAPRPSGAGQRRLGRVDAVPQIVPRLRRVPLPDLDQEPLQDPGATTAVQRLGERSGNDLLRSLQERVRESRSVDEADLSGRTSVVYRPGDNRDIGTTDARDDRGRCTTLFFERVVCRRNLAVDIYSLRD